MRYYESRTWEHEQDLKDKDRAQKNAEQYKKKYLSLRKIMRDVIKHHGITPSDELAKLLGIKL